jgi:hypothetical protein
MKKEKEQWEIGANFGSILHRREVIADYLSQGWHKKDGSVIPYKDMSTEYIKNCIKAIKKQNIGVAYLPYLELELSRR